MKLIKIQLLLGHVARMDSSNSVCKVIEYEPVGGNHRKERPRRRWLNKGNEHVTTLGIGEHRDVWRRKLAEAKTCNSL